jgi:phage portal protein BeeE
MFENAGVTGLWTPRDIATAAAAEAQTDALRQTMDDLQNSREPGTSIRPYVNVPMDYTSYGMDSKEMDLVSSRRLSKEFIANVFNYPIPLLSSEASTYNNVDNAVKSLVTNTIYGNLCSYRDRMANGWYLKKLKVKPNTYFIDFDLSMLPELQGDFQKMVDSLSKMDWLTFDEKREAMKYDVKGGAYASAYISSSMVPIELAGDMGNITNDGTY